MWDLLTYSKNGDPKERCIVLGVTNVEKDFFLALHLKLLYVVSVCKK